ncbi:MAG: cell division ATP-binding protein FtsE [Dissulfurimicrobium sp.]|uniref:cell division ATP-binding protein FtsE n=1 Tax=Dissulfurimicrobium TaxID=1769732 RepID=UPI001EDAC544|nr:cell division ATP-binding protein FtsE [Dissulfurimicrobium hydrothermale]UKL12949.1 cell division ATP-binding protein FtsE [Dissulfurimicrobium hydrothermale]
MTNHKISIIRMEGVLKRYPPDIVALYDINLDVDKGEFLFVTGQSGSGKTTLLRLLCCADRPSSGEIYIDGIALSTVTPSQLPFIRRKIGVIFQDFKLLERRTVFENVALSLEVIGLTREQLERRVRQILERLGLGNKMDRFPLQLSGGEQQRVAIARAVANRPQIILADEPTGNLDRSRAKEVMSILEELNAEGATVICATHNERLYEHGYKRILRLVDGKLTP